MSQFLIYRASAGSGKTFELVLQYLIKVFENPKNYRSILAVTFTNKAADEMKSRIFSVLHELDKEPEKSYYLEKLRDRFNQTDEWISRSAGKIKTMMLHDYSRISIETIDRFFQGILRTFARESGLAPSYQLELDSQKVLSDFTRYIFSQVSTDQVLREWLTDWITERMDQGEKWQKLEVELVQTGSELLKEEILELILDGNSHAFSEEKIQALKKQSRSLVHGFREKIASVRERTRDLLIRFNLEPADFYYASAGPAGYLYKLEPDKEPHSRALGSLDDASQWLKKDSPRKDEIEKLVVPQLNSLMHEAVNLFQNEYFLYLSAKAVNHNLFALWFAGSLMKYLQEYSKSTNQILLTLTQPLIQMIIRNNPSPFIYEKTGTYFHHFLIDEFQDTSDLQWKNFKPLIENSLAEDGLNMVVGDVKQALYRWRNSNWKLIHGKAANDLSRFGVEVTPLSKNQRSRKAIIESNNMLFSRLPDKVISRLTAKSEASPGASVDNYSMLSEAYTGVCQDPGIKSDAMGLVELHFINRLEKTDNWKDRIAEILPSIVADILENRGYRQEDILFLVRSNREADLISQVLTEYIAKQPEKSTEPWSFVSADVFRVGSSQVVQIILLVYRYLTSEENYYLDLLNWELKSWKMPDTLPQPDSDLSGRLFLETALEPLKGRDPLSVLDEVVSLFDLARPVNEIQYLYQFRDQVNTFGSKSSGHIAGFLDWWDVSGINTKLVTESQASAMRIMTIHKAKGLSSPVVIIPYCHWTFDHSAQKRPWLWVQTKGTPFDSISSIPVRYSSSLEKTCFAESYRSEQVEAALDNLNLLYVAFTRATDLLYAFCPVGIGPYSVADAIESCVELQPDQDIYRSGEIAFINPAPTADIPSSVGHLPGLSIFNKKENIQPAISQDYSSVYFGRLIHRILESVDLLDDIGQVIQLLHDSGDISKEDLQRVKTSLDPIITMPEIRDWYSGKWNVMNEPVILVPASGEKRPDRVMISDNQVIVVDYKTGNVEPQHESQVSEYMQLIRQMGYEKIRGYLLYLDPPLLKEVRFPADSFPLLLFDPEV